MSPTTCIPGKPSLLLLACSLLIVSACDQKTSPKLQNLDQSPHKQQPAPVSETVPHPRRANDVHTHLSPLSYPAAIKLMDENGLHRVVNMSGGHGIDYITHNLQAADQAVPNQPNANRIALFYNINWAGIDEPDFGQRRAAELEQAVKLGYAGLKIAKNLGLGVKTADGKLLTVDDPRLDPIWKKAGELGIVVGIHTGDPKAFFEPSGPQNERNKELSHAPNWSFHGPQFPERKELLDARDRLIARHPNTTFMLLHFANNPEDVDYVDKLLTKYPNTVVDVAARLGEIGRHDPKHVHEIFTRHQNRILFGTDFMFTVQPHKGQLAYSLTLGSMSENPPTLESVKPFFDQHWLYFESDLPLIDHPVPIQGDWQVKPIHLPPNLLDKLYYQNSERLIFAPWLARRTANHITTHALLLTNPTN